MEDDPYADQLSSRPINSGDCTGRFSRHAEVKYQLRQKPSETPGSTNPRSVPALTSASLKRPTLSFLKRFTHTNYASESPSAIENHRPLDTAPSVLEEYST